MEKAVYAFALQGKPLSCRQFGSGHINDTYRVETDAGRSYVLQRVNRQVFHDVPSLMRNVSQVIAHLEKKDATPRRVLSLVKTNRGEDYHVDDAGEYWRVTHYIPDTVCLDLAGSPEDMRQCGCAFGRFRQLLADFPADTLTETIPHFHDTPLRFQALHRAIEEDPAGRKASVLREIEFALSREREAGALIDMQQAGLIPTCVTHNDTKLNNVMLDKETHRALCVIDLDTVMPGLAAYDFGDSIRFGASTAVEDERDLSLVKIDMALYSAYVKGYITDCEASLTRSERESLAIGSKMMTLECGVRFLTDHLMGDTYFQIGRENHNLDRARAQFQLLRSMDEHFEQMLTETQSA